MTGAVPKLAYSVLDIKLFLFYTEDSSPSFKWKLCKIFWSNWSCFYASLCHKNLHPFFCVKLKSHSWWCQLLKLTFTFFRRCTRSDLFKLVYLPLTYKHQQYFIIPSVTAFLVHLLIFLFRMMITSRGGFVRLFVAQIQVEWGRRTVVRIRHAAKNSSFWIKRNELVDIYI